MAIHTFSYRALLLIAALALAAGCSDPKSNPYVAPPPLREGTPLDLSATHIGNNGGRPWMVNSDWTIEAGRTVEIDPGTTIMFSGIYNVNVDGKILAHGQPDDGKITFTSAFLSQDLGQWGNIRLRNTTDPSELSYCVFSYGAHFNDDTSSETSKFYRGMLSIRNSSPVIENCLAIFNQDNAIYIHADSNSAAPAPTIRFNVFTKNDGAALRTHVSVELAPVNFSYNAVGDNNVIPFLLAQPDSTYGERWIVNANLDSVDLHYNLLDEDPPELADPVGGTYSLTSCSPAVDAGPVGLYDGDGTRLDLGPTPYHPHSDFPILRGVVTGSLTANTTYQMVCHIRVPQDSVLIIPRGTRIEATGLYNLEIFGRLEIQGTEAERVVMCNCQVADLDVWGGLRFFPDSLSAPSIVHYADFQNYSQLDVLHPGVEFLGVRFTGGYQYGAYVATGSADLADSVSFQDCEFSNCGSYGVWSDSSAITVRNSLFQNIKGRGISINAVGLGSEITNTVVRACSTSAIALENLTNTRIINCVLTDNGYHGLQLTRNCNPVVMNTIIWANHHKGVYALASSEPVMEYNDIYGNIERDFDPASLTCANCIAADPLFGSGSDGHLTPGSPCIDAGNPDPQYNDVDGSRNDQGAYGGPAGGTIGPAMYGPKRMVVQR